MDVRTVNAPDYTWEAVLDREGLFDYSFPVLIQPNNEHMRHGTVDFGSPNVSPITSRKLPDAKKRKGSRPRTRGENVSLRVVFSSR